MENDEMVCRDGVKFHSEGFNSRPNHFFHDSLGDPDECEENHNHPA